MFDDPEDRLLIAIGRLTVTFSAMDLIVSDFAICWLRCDDADVGERVVLPLAFGAKIDLLCWLAEFRAKRSGPAANLKAQIVLEHAHEAKELATVRNDVVHGLITGESQDRGRRFWNLQRGHARTSAEPADVEAVVGRLKRILADLTAACYDYDAVLDPSQVPQEERD